MEKWLLKVPAWDCVVGQETPAAVWREDRWGEKPSLPAKRIFGVQKISALATVWLEQPVSQVRTSLPTRANAKVGWLETAENALRYNPRHGKRGQELCSQAVKMSVVVKLHVWIIVTMWCVVTMLSAGVWITVTSVFADLGSNSLKSWAAWTRSYLL
mmetsp:Transcript_130/g.142  ORF Transcript_130/g.142 Transcript_130/m.142 type:complete len:157 (+) Transcript_130:512-982(+)